jgi:PKD repeat protein
VNLKPLAVALGVATVTVMGLPATALASTPAALVSSEPLASTPHVLDGEVEAIARIGHTVVVGGDFTQVQNNGQSAVLSRNNLFTYDETTGKITPGFAPTIAPLGNAITSIIPTGDGHTVYLAGSFTTINGTMTGRIARLDVFTGQIVSTFKAARPNATVNDMALSNGRLIVAGDFSSLAPPAGTSVARAAIASLDPTTGALTSAVTDKFTGIGTKGTTSVRRIDVSPAGDRLIAIGNFSSVDGQPRSLIAQLNIGGPTSSLSSWQTTQFPAFDSGGQTWCSRAFPSYMRDVAYSTDGSYFLVVTTGAYHSGRLCDTQTRWETSGGANQLPTWVQYTGGDTSTDIVPAANGKVFYVGGHFRWLNNPFAGDRAGAGAVSRIGLAAIDPRNGMPYSWNPTRERGYGVYSFLPTSDGLFVGSDTNHLANEFHPRLGFFPADGGVVLPHEHVSALPATVYLMGRTSGGSANDLRSLTFNGTSASALTTAPGSDAWGSVRGAFSIDNLVYTGWSDGTLRVRTFDGTTFGPSAVVPMSSPDVNSASGFTPTNNFASDLSTITGMFYDRALGRIYYTQSSSASLYFRYFEPESNIVGAQKFTATGNTAALDPRNVNGMFLADGQIYFSNASGQLKSIGYTNGQVAPGVATTVDVSTDWRTRGMFAWDGGVDPNVAPVVHASANCTGLTCTFDSVGSDDPDGTITSYSWDYGDGSAADSGGTATHTFAFDGHYTVTLTATDNVGAPSSTTVAVDVARPPNVLPTASMSVHCVARDCTFDATGSADSDGTLVSYEWDFGDGSPTGSGATASHTYATPGDYPVQLTVTDDRSGQDNASGMASPTQVATTIDFRAATSYSGGSVAKHTITVPAAVRPGDGMLLFVSNNNTNSITVSPAGWTQLSSATASDLTTVVFYRAAQPGDAGANVSVTFSAATKTDIELSAYSGVSSALPTLLSAMSTTTTADHATPDMTVPDDGDWVVSYWSDKSVGTTMWTAPAGQVVRGDSVGTGSGHVSSLLTDDDAPAFAGARSGLTASTDVASGRGTTWTVILPTS